MNKQRINELGSDIRTLHNQSVEEAVKSYMKGELYTKADELTEQHNAKLLALINLALDADDTMEKLFNLLEKK